MENTRNTQARSVGLTVAATLLIAGIATITFAALGGASGATRPAAADSTEADRDAADGSDETSAAAMPSTLDTSPATTIPAVSTVPATTASTTAPASPTPTTEPGDPDPEPGAVPADLRPLEHAAGASSPSPEPDVVREPFTRIGTTSGRPPAAALEPTFAPVTLFPDLLDGLGGEGGLTLAAATGCADHCISDASITTAGGSSSRYDLRVDVESAATLEAFLSFAPIEKSSDGRFLPPSSTPNASKTVGFTWTTSFDLEPATVYHLLVRATDEQGTSAVAGTFTTAEPMGPADLAVPQPCADGCIDDIAVDSSDDGTELTIGLTSTTAADIVFAWSTEQFIFEDGLPALADPSTAAIRASAGGRTTARLSGFVPNTAYSLLVTATDDGGATDTWVARVGMPSPTIIAGIDRAHISGDGDDGRLNDGEIKFRFGTLQDKWGYRGEEKLSSNTTLRLGRDASRALEADGAGKYPGVLIYAGERDGTNVRTCFIGAGEPDDWRPDDTVTWCNKERTTWSNVWTPSMSLIEIQALPRCADFDIVHTGADHCMRIETAPNSPDQVSFDAVVWFDLDPLTGN